MALVLRGRLHTFPIEFAYFYVGLVHVDGGPRAVALVLHWLAFHTLLVLWCFTGYYFVDDTRSHTAWRSSSAPVYTYFQLILRFAGCAVVAFYTYFQGKGCHAASVAVCLVGCLGGCLAGSLVGFLAGWLVGWFADWLVGWLVGWLAVWLAGWLAD